MRKNFKRVLKIFGGLLVLVLLLAAGLLIWLRTSQAETFIQRLLTEELTSQGIILRLDRLEGPLPGCLKLTGLELADVQGPWLRVKEAEIQVDLLSLPGRELAFRLLRLDSPELLRLPALAADSEAEAEQIDLPTAPGLTVRLPFSLRFDNLSLENGKIGQAVLDASSNSPTEDLTVTPQSASRSTLTALPGMSVNLHGHGALSRRGLNLNLEAALLHTDGSGLKLALYTGPTRRAPQNPQFPTGLDPADSAGGETIYWPLEISGRDTLEISLTAREDHGGLLAQLSGQPDLPAYDLRLEGSGPPQNWAARLNLDVADKGSSLFNLNGQLGFHSEDSGINFDRLFNSRLLTWLDLRLTPGAGLADGLRAMGKADKQDNQPRSTEPGEAGAAARSEAGPAARGGLGELGTLLAPALEIRAEGGLEDGIFHLESAGLETASWLLQANNLEFAASPLDGSRLKAGLTAQIKDVPAFLQILAGQNAPDTLPVQAASPIETASVDGAASSADVAAPVPHSAALTTDLQIGFGGAGQNILSILADGQLEALPLTPGLRLHLALQSNELTGSGASSGNSGSGSTDDGKSGGGTPHNGQANGTPATTASIRLTGDMSSWSSPQLDALLAGKLLLDADFSGSGPDGYTFALSALDAGQAHLSGQAKLLHCGPPGAWGSTLRSSARLQAAFLARLDSLAPLLDGSGFTEQATAQNRQTHTQSGQATLHGASLNLTATGPVSDLNLKSLLRVADLHTASGLTLNGLKAELSAQGSNFSAWNGLLAFDATLQNKEIRLESGWDFAFSGNQGLMAGLRGLQARADGLALNADIQARLDNQSGQTAPLILDGEGRLEITDWTTIAALSGARLSGDPATASFKIAPEAAGQNLALSYTMGRISLSGSDDSGHGIKNNLFTLRSLNMKMTASDIFRLPRFDLKLEAGSGRAGSLGWRSGTASLDFVREAGAFRLALLGWNRNADGGRTTGRSQQENSRHAEKAESNGELLSLAGSFNLAGQSASLDLFNLRSADGATGIKLLTPAPIDFSRGLSLPALKLGMTLGGGSGMTPGGSLVASVALDANGEQFKVTVSNLDFRVFSLFSAAHLPTGVLNLDADFKRHTQAGAQSGGQPDGRLTLQALLLPEQELDQAAAAPDNPEVAVNGQALAQLRESAQGQAVTFTLAAGLSPDPLPAFPALRRQAGFSRLQGQGCLSYAGAPENFRDALLNFDLPLRLNRENLPGLDFDSPLGVSLNWRGPAEPFRQIIPMADRTIEGFGEVALTLGGSLNRPLYSGSACLASGRYEDRLLGLLLEGINLEIRGNNSQLDFRLAANDGGQGSLALEGALLPPGSAAPLPDDLPAAAPTAQTASETQAALPAGSGNPAKPHAISPASETASVVKTQTASGPEPQLRLRGQINHLSPLHRDDLSLQLSGIFGVNGPLSAPAVSANLELERGEYNLRQLGGGVRTLEISDSLTDETGKAGETAETAEAEASSGPTLDVHLNIPNRFYVRGMGLESEWAGSLRAFGLVAQPELTGNISPVRGYFELLSRPFAFSGGGAHFLGGKKINPGLDLQLTYAGPSLTALIDIGGTASRPRLSLRSTPPRPQDQVLAEVLFGKDFSSLSRFEAIQVASSLQQLSGGGFDFMGSMRRVLGVDMLRVSGGESTAQQQRNTYGTLGASDLGAGSGGGGENSEDMPRLEAGKYINDSIYVGFEQGVTENSTGVRVEVELRPNLTLQGRSNTQSSEVGLGWKKDY